MSAYIYDGFLYSEPKRNEPVCAPAANPLPENKMSSDTGDAGRDGYSVLSRANRDNGLRPSIGGHRTHPGPNMAQEQ